MYFSCPPSSVFISSPTSGNLWHPVLIRANSKRPKSHITNPTSVKLSITQNNSPGTEESDSEFGPRNTSLHCSLSPFFPQPALLQLPPSNQSRDGHERSHNDAD